MKFSFPKKSLLQKIQLLNFIVTRRTLTPAGTYESTTRQSNSAETTPPGQVFPNWRKR